MEDDVFLGYFIVDSDGKKRPIPAPRRLAQTPVTNDRGSTTSDGESTVVIVQGSDGEPAVIKAMDPRTTLRSFVGLKPRRRRKARVEDQEVDVAQDSRNDASKSGKEVAPALV